MPRRWGIGIALAVSLASIGCGLQAPVLIGSGVLVGESYDLQDFDRLSIHDDLDVTVLQGEGFAVEVSADDNVIDFVKIEQQGDALHLGLSKPLRLEGATVVCVVHLPQLARASVQGVSKLRIKSLAAEQLDLDVSGASHLEGELTGGHVTLSVSGASQAQLTGRAETLVASVSGASKAQLSQLVVKQEASILASGASTAHVNASGQLSMVASGASNVTFAGTPSIIRSDTHGASSIRPE